MSLSYNNNDNIINPTIFPINDLIRSQIDTHAPEPDWSLVIFTRIPQTQMLDFLSMIKKEKYNKNPYYYFLRGIMNEFGIKTPINNEIALDLYMKGANLNDSFCLFRLYFIYRNPKNFKIIANRDLEMISLIKSAAYFDYYSDERFIFYPFYQLAFHLDKEDLNIEKSHSLVNKMKNIEINQLKANSNCYNDQKLKEKEQIIINNYRFLDNWIYIRFYLNENDQNNGYLNIKDLAENYNHLESLFLLSELNIGHLEGGHEYDLNKIEQYLLICTENFIIKAFSALGSLYERKHNNLKSIEFYKKAAKLGCFKGIYEYASYLITGHIIEANFKKGIKYFLRGYWLGYLYSADHLVLILTNKENKKKYKLNSDEYKLCYDISNNISKFQNFISGSFLKYGPQFYLLAICLEKGLLNNQKDYEQALEILLKGLENKSLKEKKYVEYRIGRIYDKMGEKEKAHIYYKQAYLKYLEIMNNYKIYKYPAQFYRIAKLIENGWGVEKDLDLAADFYKKGMVHSRFFFLLQFYYQKKCTIKFNYLSTKTGLSSNFINFNCKKILTLDKIDENLISVTTSNKKIEIWDIKKDKIKCVIPNAFDEKIIGIKPINNRLIISFEYPNSIIKIWNEKKLILKINFVLNNEWMNNPIRDFIIIDKNIIIFPFGNIITVYNYINKTKLIMHNHNNYVEVFTKINSIFFLEKYNLLIVGDNNNYLTSYSFQKNKNEISLKLINTKMISEKCLSIDNILCFNDKNIDFLIVSTKNNEILIFKIDFINNSVNYNLIKNIKIEKLLLKGLSFSKESNLFFMGDNNGYIYFFDQNSSIIQNKFKSHNLTIKKSITFQDNYLLTFSKHENYIRKWNIKNLLKN